MKERRSALISEFDRAGMSALESIDLLDRELSYLNPREITEMRDAV